MSGGLIVDHAQWLQLIELIAGAIGLIVLPAAVAGRALAGPVARRTVWQVVLVAIFAFTCLELTGTARALVAWFGAPGDWLNFAAAPGSAQPAALARQTPAVDYQGSGSPAASPGSCRSGNAAKDSGSRIRENSGRLPALPKSHDFGYGQSSTRSARNSVSSAQLNRARRCRSGRAVEVGQAGDEPRSRASETQPAPVTARTPTVRGSWWPGILWLAGLALCFGRIVGSRAVALILDRRGRDVAEPALRAAAAELAERLGAGRRVRLRQHRRLATPVAYGVLWPTVAVPPSFSTQYKPSAQRAILAHELAHLAAHDPAWLLLGEVVCALHWWHPLVWLARGQLRLASETAADDASLIVPDGPDALAASLVATGRQITATTRLGWVSVRGVGYRSALGRRVQRLLSLSPQDWRPPRPGRLALARIALVILLLTPPFVGSAWLRPGRASAKGETTVNLFQQSWNRSLAAAAMATLLAAGPVDAESNSSGPATDVDQAASDAWLQLAMLDEDQQEEREHRAGAVADDEQPDAVLDEDEDADVEVDVDEDEHEHEHDEDADEDEHEHDEDADEDEHEHEHEDADEEEEEEEEEEEHERATAAWQAEQRELRRAIARLDQERGQVESHLAELGQELERVDDEPGAEAEERREDLDLERREVQLHMRRIERERRRLEDQLARHEDECGEDGLPPCADRPASARLEHLKQLIGQLRDENRPEEADRLERKVREIAKQLADRRARAPRRPRPDRDDAPRRLHHLQVAAANLEAAGMHELAHRVAEEAAEVERQVGARDRRDPRGRRRERPSWRREDVGPERPGPPPEQLEQAIDQLHKQMEQMHAEMDQMRRHLERVTKDL